MGKKCKDVELEGILVESCECHALARSVVTEARRKEHRTRECWTDVVP